MQEKNLELGIWVLPEECIAHIISLTSPRDACSCSAVSSKFRSVAESDTVWERFLPSYWEDIVCRSVSPVKFSSKKALYFHLCQSPIFIDQGNNKVIVPSILVGKLIKGPFDNLVLVFSLM